MPENSIHSGIRANICDLTVEILSTNHLSSSGSNFLTADEYLSHSRKENKQRFVKRPPFVWVHAVIFTIQGIRDSLQWPCNLCWRKEERDVYTPLISFLL